MRWKKVGFLPLIVLLACDVHINKNFDIADNTTVENDLITVNGSINIGENCIVNGTLNTVNGSIQISRFTRVDASLQTVNGSIEIEQKCKIDGNISAITGAVEISDECSVVGNISNISGDIDLNNVVVDGDVSTNFGDITVAKKSQVNGAITIEDNDEIPEKLRTVKIVITDSSIVREGIINKNKIVDVSVFVEPGSQVNGDLIDVDIIDEKNDLGYE
jgi:DUF4097 and DUF4098 domain-containing protein YvlB